MVRVLSVSVFCAALALLLVFAAGQSDFISIDCGIPENTNYTDEKTGIMYISDTGFIDTGEAKSISLKYENETFERQFKNVRSFPEGVRNCYNIRSNVVKDNRYLIRARFMYGNYDNINEAPRFDLFLGVDRWDSIVLNNASNRVTKELIHVPSLDYMQICLINIGFGVPFISALELRLLDNSTYATESGSLKLYQRIDFGLKSNQIGRYANDTRDRIWSPSNSSASKLIESSNVSNSIQQNTYELPSDVMKTAYEPKNSSQPLEFFWPQNDNITAQFYIYMHFAEVHKLKINEYRAFNISINQRFWFGPMVPALLSTSTVYSTTGVTAQTNGSLLVTLNKTDNSTLPPLINAIEIFIEKQFQQLQTSQDEFDALLNIKSAYNVKKNWQGDPCYPQIYLWAGLNCSYNGERQPNITSLNLSSSELAGAISSAISNLTMLQFLDLSNNSLNGTVPKFLAELPNLRVLKLDNNNLSGTIPPGLFQQSKNGNILFSSTGNPYLCLSEPCSKKEEKKYVIPLAASLGGVALLLIIGGAIFLARRRRKQQGESIPKDNKFKASVMPKKKQFTYSEILTITNNFERVIGKGGFGTVYSGYLDNIQVSVKMLSPASVQGYMQFQAEGELLTKAHHGNLTSVFGYCNEDTHLGILYEYMENGNLADHLSGKISRNLNWKERLGIALGAAQGLEYLHCGCKPPIIHRDIKSTNILLDENYNAKLADFGMSKDFQLDGVQASEVVGTPGYLDPEYHKTKKLSEKSDVYSFGVVLLEIITGRQALAKSGDKTHIVLWVNSMLKEGKIKNIPDPKLEIDIDNNSILKFVGLAMSCVSSSSTERPAMNQVVMALKQCLDDSEKSWKSNHEPGSIVELVSVTSVTHFQER